MKTKVIFRMWHGEVIAIFPEIPSSVLQWYTCESYLFVGQHGGCDPYVIIPQSRLATQEEYASMKTHLESIGYVLDVRKRLTSDMNRVRESEWRRMME